MLSQVSRVILSIPLSHKASLIGTQRIAEFTLSGQAIILSPTMQEHLSKAASKHASASLIGHSNKDRGDHA
ncbi:hypothetical protein [Cupriavidus necator]